MFPGALCVLCSCNRLGPTDCGCNRLGHLECRIGARLLSQETVQSCACHCNTLATTQATLNHVEDAHRLVDEAISAALTRKKPAYIEVCVKVFACFAHKQLLLLLG